MARHHCFRCAVDGKPIGTVKLRSSYSSRMLYVCETCAPIMIANGQARRTVVV